MDKQYYVYILTNATNKVLYTGVTHDLRRRVLEHRQGIGSDFTERYHINKLVYYEITGDVKSAILREKQIKAGSRQRKLDLVVSFNPQWVDLYDKI